MPSRISKSQTNGSQKPDKTDIKDLSYSNSEYSTPPPIDSVGQGYAQPQVGVVGEEQSPININSSQALNFNASEKPLGAPDYSLVDYQEHELLILPSGNQSFSLSDLNPDGYVLPNGQQVLKVGSKIGLDQNRVEVGQDEINSSALPSLSKIKGKFNISWQSLGRRLAILSLVIGVVGIVFLTVLAAYVINIYNGLPSIDDILKPPSESSSVYARDGKTVIYEYVSEARRQIVSLNKVSLQMQLAVVGLEDQEFYYNADGIPWRNIAGAALQCLASAGDDCRGGSGLYQQLAKNATGKNDANVDRKIKELLTAYKFNEGGKTKQDILELYLNYVPFGNSAYGVEEAAKTYFNKDIQDVDVSEACFIAALTNQPSYLSSGIGKPQSGAWKDLIARKNTCLDKLHNQPLQGDGKGVFLQSEEEYQTLLKKPAELALDQADGDSLRQKGVTAFILYKPKIEFPHFVDYIKTELEKMIPLQKLYTQGYKIVTTIDPDMQRGVDKVLKDSEPSMKANGADNVAAVVLDGTNGQVVSMVGSLDYYKTSIDGQFNFVTQAVRQPGSSIKPIVYASAMLNGFNPGTVVLDASTDFGGGFKPKNFSGNFSGPIALHDSLQQSLNIPAIKAECLSAAGPSGPDCQAGLQKVEDVAESLGLIFPCSPDRDGGEDVCKDPVAGPKAYRNSCGLSLAIGGCAVNMLSHASAFNSLIHDGNVNPPVPFLSIKDKQGKEIFDPELKQQYYPTQEHVLDPLISREMAHVLSDNEARKVAFGPLAANFVIKECTPAAKTGTTDNVVDTWTIGGCSNYTTAVWLGNHDNTPLKALSSSNTVLPIWHDVTEFLQQGKKAPDFSTEGLVPVTLDRRTGLRSSGGSVRTEYITPAQLSNLDAAARKFSGNDYNARDHNIYENRTISYAQEVQINKLDGKLATAQTLPENIEKKTCVIYFPEFPNSKVWSDPIDRLYGDTNKCKPTEKSDQNQVDEKSKGPQINSNLDGSVTNVQNISLTANVQGTNTKTITKVEILIDGNSVSSSGNNSLVFSDINNYASGSHTVLLRAQDSFGGQTEKVYQNVIFFNNSNSSGNNSSNNPTNPPSITNPKLTLPDFLGSGVTYNCGLGNLINHTTTPQATCTISNLPSGKIAPNNLRVGIGNNNGFSQNCIASTPSFTSFICSNTPVPSSPTTSKIFILSDDFGVSPTNTQVTAT